MPDDWGGLFDFPAPGEDPEDDDGATTGATIQERFENFHAKHPEVYRAFCRIAEELRYRKDGSVKVRHWGAKAIIEVIRYRYVVAHDDAEDFKINNNYTSRYARLFLNEHPEFAGFFELRELKAA